MCLCYTKCDHSVFFSSQTDFLPDDFDTTDEALLQLLQEASIQMPSTVSKHSSDTFGDFES